MIKLNLNKTVYRLKVIALIVNGESFCSEESLTISQLLEKLELQGKKLALERNGEIVPRSLFHDKHLSDGDKVEIVIAIGGG